MYTGADHTSSPPDKRSSSCCKPVLEEMNPRGLEKEQITNMYLPPSGTRLLATGFYSARTARCEPSVKLLATTAARRSLFGATDMMGR